ncbi:O-antigen ligase family protein [Oxalobacteraceae bacterium OTU3REALA1]|nr:O-antigen ligase family protein [Oxalobacteraceae bacterium OTU3REALA1]
MNTASTPPPLPEKGSPLASTLLFALPALALGSKSGLGAVQVVILLIFLIRFRPVWSAYQQYWFELSGVILAFSAYFVVSLLRMLLDDQGLRTLDGPSRLLLGLSCIGVMYHLRPRTRYFWMGLCATTVTAALLAIYQTLTGIEYGRAVGFTHHAITFGNLALASGLMGLCGMAAFRGTRLAWLPVVALLCGMVASILSGSRGGWLALPLAMIPLVYYGRHLFGRRLRVVCGLMLALLAVACLVPAIGMAGRIGVAVDEVQRYLSLGDATTSVGIRLELWKASIIMFSEHPWLGVGRDDFHTVLNALADAGRLQQGPALEFSSSHNDLLHCLATGGVLDASLLLLLYIMPLRYFVAQLRRPDQGQHPLALAGLVVVVAFMAFGLTDVMFWLMMTKVFYVMMVSSLIGMCLATQYTPPPRRIMITRTDNIGDVVLTLPLAGYLKQRYPQAEIVFLCRRYAAAVVAQCRHVDTVQALEDWNGDLAGGMARSGCDTVMFAYPRRQLAVAARRAGIARRVGSIRRFYHWFTCNRLAHMRAKSLPILHEAQLSFKLLQPLGFSHIPSLDEIAALYGLDTPRHPAADAVLAAPGFKLILHPKSNGNGREWPLEHYTALARMLGPDAGVRVLVTGSAGEGELLAGLAPELLALPHVENLCGRLDLDGFTALVGGCDGLVASGTGPLHLAAALGRPVAGLFPPLKPIDPSRWAAIGPRATNLVNSTMCGHCSDPARCTCMLAITPQQVFAVIQGWRDEAARAAA